MEQESWTVGLNAFIYSMLCLLICEFFLLDYYLFDKGLRLGVASGTDSSLLLFAGSIFAIFSHSGWSHLIGNMVCMLLCMPLLCRKLTAPQLLSLTIVGTLGTGYIAWSLDTREFGEAMHIGCSGLVWAYSTVVLAYCFRHFKAGLFTGGEFISYVGIFLTILLGIDGLFPSDNFISWQMHIGGFIIGLIFSVYLLIHREAFLYKFYHKSTLTSGDSNEG